MKRFVDTALGRKAWFRKLSPSYKCAWRFLCDECDCAGAWSIDMDSMTFHVGEEIDLNLLIDALNSDGEERVRLLGVDKLWLTGFVDFQYGSLSESCKPHLRVISRLKELTLWKGYAKGFQTLEEEEEDKDKEEDKEKEEEEEKPLKLKFDFEALYQKYPRKLGKQKGIEKCKAQIKTPEEFEALSKAIDQYVFHLRSKGTEEKFIKHFDSFMTIWRDWLDPATGQSESFGQAPGQVDWAKVFGKAAP